MSTRSLFYISVVLIGSLAGCQATPPAANPPVAAQPPTPVYAPAQTPVAPIAMDRPVITDQHPSPETLARQAREYADQLEQKVARRATSSATPAGRPMLASAANPGNPDAPVPSDVRFIDPAGASRQQTIPAPAAPIAAAQPPAPLPTADPRLADPRPAAAAQLAPAPAPTITQTPPRTEVAFNKDSPAVNVPLIVGQPRPLPASDDLAQRFKQQVKDYPQDVAGHLDWQLMQFIQGQSVPQLQSLAPLPAEDREMLSAVLDGLTNFRNGLRADNNMLFSGKIRPLLEAADRLRTMAELQIPVVALCTDVKGFGVYEPIEPARFEAGKEHRVIVYCEVQNFASMLDEQKRWETKLTQEVVLYTEQGGEEVWRDKAPARPIVDYSRNRRHDFFIVKMIRLPANLTIDRYLLKVTVVDQQMNRVAENTVPVQIMAQ